MTLTTTTKTAARAVLGIAFALSLAACGGDESSAGGDGDGEYYGQDGGDLATVVVDGSSITYSEPQCEGEDKRTSVGELNEDRSLVVWLEEGRFSGDDLITFTESSVNRPGKSGDSVPWEGWSHVRKYVEEVPGRAA